ncbi:MAG: response regulator [Hyphomicrobium sp.]
MSLTDLPAHKNQITSRFMNERETLKIEARAIDPLAVADGFNGFLSIIFVVAAASAVVFGLLVAGAGEPLSMTLISVLAMLGLFLLFGIAAGHIRIGARLPEGDLIKAAIDAIDDPVIVSNGSGTAQYWNHAHEAMFGASEDGPLPALERAFGGEPEAGQAFFRLMRAAERGETRREDIKLRISSGNTGRPAWMRISVRPFASPGRDASDPRGGREMLVLWQIADITNDRLREAQKIGDLESALAGFDAMPAGFLAISSTGSLAHANTTFESWLGYAPGDLRAGGVTLAQIAGDDGARLLAQLALGADSERRAIDLDLTREDGRVVPLTMFAEPAPSGFTLTALNRAVMGTGSARDTGEIRFSHFFQSAPFGIATLDGVGRIASANSAFLRIVLDGRTADGMLVHDALIRNAEPHEVERFEAGLKAALSGRGNIAPIDVTGGDSKQVTHRIYLSPLSASTTGEKAALYVIDITEQKALEQRFAQAQKMEAVGKLAGGIAHDFNNVLTAIIGFSDLLLQTHRPSDPAYKDIKNIQSAANRAAGLVANLLGFSRKQTQQVSTLNLGELTTDLTPMLRTSIGEKIELKIQSERDLWYVKADRTQIDNVIINLSVNARDAMPTGGKLTIRTRNITERESQRMSHVVGFTPGEYVQIDVEDTGTGMSPEVMTKIFEPFFTTKGVGKGTGLGLASVYGIVKQSGGFILPESEIGRGTTFKIFLPRYIVEDDADVDAAQPAKAAAKRDAKAVDLTGTGTVLLVEDEVEVRQFAVRALKRQGYQVLEAADGVEALEVLAAHTGTVDIVVSDVVMPEMDGPTLFKELRKDNPGIKVIFVSGYPNEAFRESLGSEDFAFLPKPFSLPQLAEKVKEELMK